MCVYVCGTEMLESVQPNDSSLTPSTDLDTNELCWESSTNTKQRCYSRRITIEECYYEPHIVQSRSTYYQIINVIISLHWVMQGQRVLPFCEYIFRKTKDPVIANNNGSFLFTMSWHCLVCRQLIISRHTDSKQSAHWRSMTMRFEFWIEQSHIKSYSEYDSAVLSGIYTFAYL